jgi:hypothetical protein
MPFHVARHPARLLLALLPLAAGLVACSPPAVKTCSQTPDCPSTDMVCSSGLCRVAIDSTITSGPGTPISNKTAVFTFTASDPAATFECSLDTAAFAPCTSPATYAGLSDGAHAFEVRAVMPSMVEATPAGWSWTVDTTGPAVTIDATPADTQLASISFGFSSAEPGVTFECSFDGAAFAACASPKNYPSVTVGSHTFSVRGADALGNLTPTPPSWNWQRKPETTIASGPASPVASGSATFSFSSNDAAATFECKRNFDAVFSACTSPMSYSGMADGAWTFQVRASAGGLTDLTPASYSWTIDTTGPVVNITAGPAAIQSEDPVFTFSSPEAGVTGWECSVDSTTTWTACSSPRTLTGVAVGSHTFRARARDALGNITPSPASWNWTLAPETSLTCNPMAATNRTTERFAFSSTTAGATFECKLDGGLFAACTSPWSYAVGNGSHTVSVRAISAGVTDPTPAATTFMVSTSSALVWYNFEYSGVSGGLLTTGYTAVLNGAAAYSGAYSHAVNGLTSVYFNATDGTPVTGRGSVTLTGVRAILSNDCVATDAKYSIAFDYWEPNPANTMNGATFLYPFIFDTRGSGGGFEIYHGVGAVQPPGWTLCWSSTPSGGTCTSTAGLTAATWHRMVFEYAYNSGTGAYDLSTYLDGLLKTTTSSAVGATIFNATQTDPVLGNDWKGYIDDVKVYNASYAGNPP